MSKPVTVDNKGRLKVPVSLLATLKEFGNEFFITSEDGDSVRIYSPVVSSQLLVQRLCPKR